SPLVRRRGLVALVHHVHREQWRIIYPGLSGRVGWFVESRLTPMLYRAVPHVTVSDASRRDLIELGVPSRLVSVIHNGTPEPLEIDATRSSTPRICVLSRLVPHKQVEHAIEVVASLSGEIPGIALDVIGDGWWSDRVLACIDEHGMAGRVTMHGHVDETTKATLLEAAWLMLLPSVKEGWGIAILEAASHRTPTIAYRGAGGVRESIRDGETGILVTGVEGMRAAAAGLVADPQRLAQMAERARDVAREYTWDETVREFELVLATSGQLTGRR
ncbi:MAG: glycosyltransferase family 4 protein, partial [Marmoricola sp.]